MGSIVILAIIAKDKAAVAFNPAIQIAIPDLLTRNRKYLLYDMPILVLKTSAMDQFIYYG